MGGRERLVQAGWGGAGAETKWGGTNPEGCAGESPHKTRIHRTPQPNKDARRGGNFPGVRKPGYDVPELTGRLD